MALRTVDDSYQHPLETRQLEQYVFNMYYVDELKTTIYNRYYLKLTISLRFYTTS